jgi:hypothetical protein
MARRLVVLALAFGAFASFAACGLSTTGDLQVSSEQGVPKPNGESGIPGLPGADGSNGNGGDAGEDTGPPPPTCQTDACALPQGGQDFGVVLYGDRSAPCPTGFDTEDEIEEPTPGAGACTCGQCVMTGTSCNQGNIATKYGTTNACPNNGANHQANNGACRVQSGVFGEWASVDAPTAVPGTCSAPSTLAKSAVTTKAIRTCKPQASLCAEAFCAPPSSLKACSIHLGDVACPAGAPTKHLIGSDFTGKCGDCSCTITATCGGTFTAYAASDCTGQSKSLNVGTCTNMNQFAFASTKWAGVIATQTCNGLTPPAPTLALVGTRTVCCPN